MSEFLQFNETTIGDWRSHPVTLAFLNYLAEEADRSNYECATLLRRGEERRATAAAGCAAALELLLRQCLRKDPPREEAAEPFVDLAYRFNRNMAPQQEGNNDAGTD